MKRLSILIAFAVLAGGCADPLEQRNGEEVGAHLRTRRHRPGHDRPGTAAGRTIPPREHDVPQTHP